MVVQLAHTPPPFQASPFRWPPDKESLVSPLKAVIVVSISGAALAAPARAQLYTSSPGLVIPDQPGPSVQDVIVVTGGPEQIGEIICTINVSHAWDEDLDIVLCRGDPTSPASWFVVLSTDNGGSGDNYTGTQFVNYPGSLITSGIPPFTGRFLAEGSNATGGSWNAATSR